MTVALLALCTLAQGPAATTVAAPPPEPAVASEMIVAGSAQDQTPPPVWSVPLGHAGAVLLGMRLGAWAIWPDPYSPVPLSRSARQFKLAYTRPPEFHRDRVLLESDGDPWPINVIGHGLFGAEIYGRARACYAPAWQAAAFAVGTSVVWEYGIEATGKRPSALDLVTTPLFGAALGEGRHRLQTWLRTRPRTTLRRVIEFVIDPLGETERTVLGTRC